MKKLKYILPVILCICLVPICSFANSSSTAAGDGVITSKEEVIYANVSADGTVEKVYAVNVLDIAEEGLITDYGDFSSVENLTNTEKLTLENDIVSFTASQGRFYYRGDMKQAVLPWIFKIEYTLDGQPVSADELSGKNGLLQIKITTDKNESINDGYFENYMLQIQFTLNTENFTDIHASKATIANAGKNKVISFTAMPETSCEFSFSSKVLDFSMPSAQVTALPFSFSFSMPDTSDISEQLTALTDAISGIYSGTSGLKEGLVAITANSDDLTSASASIAEALTDLAANGDELLYGSHEILSGLQQLSENLSQMPQLQQPVLKIEEGFKTFNTGLEEYVRGIKQLATSYTALDVGISQTMNGIGEIETGAEQLWDGTKTLYEQTNDLPQTFQEEIDNLISSYDKSAFDAPSFTSALNTKTESVQFLIKIA